MCFDCIMIINLLMEIHFHKTHSGIGASGFCYYIDSAQIGYLSKSVKLIFVVFEEVIDYSHIW